MRSLCNQGHAWAYRVRGSPSSSFATPQSPCSRLPASSLTPSSFEPHQCTSSELESTFLTTAQRTFPKDKSDQDASLLKSIWASHGPRMKVGPAGREHVLLVCPGSLTHRSVFSHNSGGRKMGASTCEFGGGHDSAHHSPQEPALHPHRFQQTYCLLAPGPKSFPIMSQKYGPAMGLRCRGRGAEAASTHQVQG